ncbi:MAG: CotH kinase family protein [Chromatiales bacterium]|nr:CotH kinase family protein [Chromatiales bacterium]
MQTSRPFPAALLGGLLLLNACDNTGVQNTAAEPGAGAAAGAVPVQAAARKSAAISPLGILAAASTANGLTNPDFSAVDLLGDGDTTPYEVGEGPPAWQIVSGGTGGAVYTDSTATENGHSFFAFNSLENGFGANKLEQCVPIDETQDLRISYRVFAATPGANAGGLAVRINPNFYADYATCRADSAADSGSNRLSGGRSNSDADFGLGVNDGNQWLDRNAEVQPALLFIADDIPPGAAWMRLSVRARMRPPAADLPTPPQLRLDDIRVVQDDGRNRVINSGFEHVAQADGDFLSGTDGWQVNRDGSSLSAAVGPEAFAQAAGQVFWFETLSANFGDSRLEQCIALDGSDLRPSVAAWTLHPDPALVVRLNVDFHAGSDCAGSTDASLRIRQDFTLDGTAATWTTLIADETRSAAELAGQGSALFSIRARDRSSGGQPSPAGRPVFLDNASTAPSLLPLAVDAALAFDTAGINPGTLVDTLDLAALPGIQFGNPPAVITVGMATRGSTSASGTVISYAPDNDFFSGSDSFSYTITDSTGEVASGQVTVSIADRTPILVGESRTVNAGSTVQLLPAFSPGNGAPGDHVLSVTTPATNGLCLVDGLSLGFSSGANAGGEDSCTVMLSDGAGNSSEAVFSFTIVPIPQAIDADLNGDGVVNFADLALFIAAFGSDDPAADLNGDGIVNFADLALFQLLFGRTAEDGPLFTVTSTQLLVGSGVGNQPITTPWREALGLDDQGLELSVEIIIDGQYGEFAADPDTVSYTAELFARVPQDTGRMRIIDPTGRFRDIELVVLDVDAEPDLPWVMVEMSEADLDLLYTRDRQSNDVLPALLRFRPDEAGQPVNLRFRGSSTRVEPKKGFNIRFSDPQEFLFGGDRFNGMAMWRDPSFLRDRLSYWLFNQAGVPASDTRYYLYFMNGVFEGLYLHVQRVDEYFLTQRGFSTNATLLRDGFRDNRDLACVQSPTVFGANALGTLPREDALACITQTFDSRSPGDEDWEGLLDFILWVESSRPGEQFAQELGDWVDVEAMLKFVGSHMLIGDRDSLWGDDYWMYRENDNPDARWRFFPWDKNLTFGSHWRRPSDFPLEGTGQGAGNLFFPVENDWTTGLGGNRLFRLFVNTPSLRAALGAWLLEQIEGELWTSKLDTKVAESLDQTIRYSAALGIFHPEFARNQENRLDMYGTYEELVEQVTEYRDLRRNHLRALVSGFSGVRHEVTISLEADHPPGEILWMVDGFGFTAGRIRSDTMLPAGTIIVLRAVSGSENNPINKDWEITSSTDLSGTLSLYYRNDREENYLPPGDTNWYTGGLASIGQQPFITLVTSSPSVQLGPTTARPIVNRLDADIVFPAGQTAVISTQLP